MLTTEDLKNIQTVVNTVVNGAKNDILVSVEKNILPQIASLPSKKFLTDEIANAKNDIITSVGEMIEENVLPQIASLPNKAFITDKMADLEGSVIARQRKGDQKINLLIEFLQSKKVLADNEVKMLKTFELFQPVS